MSSVILSERMTEILMTFLLIFSIVSSRTSVRLGA